MRPAMICVAAAAALLLVGASRVKAATFAVDTTTDDPAKTACDDTTGDDCSLHGAITAANALVEASTVNVPAGTYELTQLVTCTRRFPGGVTQPSTQVALCLTAQVTIQGAGATATVIDGKGQHRVLFVSFGAVAEIRGVTLTNGIGEAPGGGVFGGCINNQGTLRLTESVVSNSTLSAVSGGAGGAGIYNAGSLTLLRSTVTTNIARNAGGGGGIYNDGFLNAVLTVIDSVISNNSIGAIGGGIYNVFGSTATVSGSTIAGNSAPSSQGGGIYNDATLTVINSTISGNQSGSSGSGITNYQHGVADLSNVTITNNTSGTTGAGRGGGIYNAASLTLRNTIVAGNFDLAGTPPLPDCDAPASFGFALTSEGYNLIGNTTGCDLIGDASGNITGQPAKLGLLLDNGGPTPTHAPADDSPALEAGNPAPPGSGGAVCVATDQRGFVRPIGERCDIGAFERGGPFAVTKVTPPVGGDIGSVSALVSGSSFIDGATVKLVRAGQPDIVGSAPRVDPGGSAITTAFNLVGQALGAWNVVVTNPDATTQTLPDAFTIEVGRTPDPWVDIVGFLTRHPSSGFRIFYGNRGNVDAAAVSLTFGASGAYGLDRFFPITRPPALPDQLGQGIWDGVGITATAGTQSDFTNVPVLLPVIPAGFTGILPIQLTLEPDAPVGTLFAHVGSPYFTAALDPQVVAAMVEGARDYSAATFGITIPATLVPDMAQYVTAQLERLVTDGRNALIATIGTSSQVYSVAQLQLDVALFGAARAVAPQASAAPLDLLALLARTSRTFAPWWPTFGPAQVVAQQQSGVVCCSETITTGCSFCNPKPDTISPSSTGLPTCTQAVLNAYIASFGATPAPNCSPTAANCNALANHKVITLSNGAQVCHPTGCANAGPNGYQNTSHCRDFPIDPMNAKDPNDKAGSLGVAAAQFVLGDAPFTYGIHFENLAAATAPAAIVIVTDALDAQHLDLETFSLGPISFGDFTLVPSPGHSGFMGSVDLRPAQNIVVTVNATLDKPTGILTWRFDSIDQATGQSTDDPSVGFLPPNENPPAGEGFVSFSVRPKAGLATGATICNQASIVFDQNDPLATASWCNTIDVAPPQSHVLSLPPTQRATDFLVQWEGTDVGAGISDFTIYVSENGGAFAPVVTNTADTSTMFSGQDGNTYAFCSLSRDRVGTIEVKTCPPVADVSTRIVIGPVCVGDCDDDGFVGIAELVTGVNIALERAPLPRCPVFDRNDDGRVQIDELVTAVSGALIGCEGTASGMWRSLSTRSPD